MAKKDVEHEFLTPQEVATKLRLHIVTVRRLLREGKLPGVKINARDWRISADALKQFVEKGGK
jgi:excisionase family DNA binding protein